MKRILSSRLRGVEDPPAAGRPPLGRRGRGIILVMTLWLVIVLSLVAYSLAYEMRMEMRLTTMRRDGLIAYELARLGVARAAADLKNDLIMDYNPDEKNPSGQPFDGPGDVWRLTEDKTDVPVGDSGSYTVRITDGESRLNLNQLALRLPNALKYLLMQLEERESAAEDVAQAICDWADPDNVPLGGKGESEIDFYSEQIARAQRVRWDRGTILIRPKNDTFVTVEELLLVPWVTPQMFYGYDPDDEEATAQREKRLAEGKDVSLGLRDCVNVGSRGWLNLNTATYESLAAMFSAVFNNPAEGDKRAEQILRYLGRTGRTEPDNDKALRSPQDLQLVLGQEALLLMSQTRGYPFHVVSQTFLIESAGQLLDSRGEPKLTRRITAFVGRDWQSYPIDEGFGERRERRSDYQAFVDRLDRARRKEMEKIGSAQVPNVRAYWWKEN